ncbi:MAG TPA: D-alanyl-D-alanine carboxypeptidase/D-alanyl-D-alanine-endopeptidase, partial [Polyangiales bacterium]|nr:D-alanyl-D-alanine carboxypeptidase/D-alanyl-D-alanine-endopeptidase [Polyangiales bacterium]
MYGKAGAQEPEPLPEQLKAVVRNTALGDRVGISIVDLRSRTSVLSHHAEQPLNPASNMKLLTAAATMIELGPQFRIDTGLYGRVAEGRAVGGLCLKGRGDPTLSRGDLMTFAQRAADEGVQKVDEVIVDGSYFDSQVLPPLFEQQPNEIAPFRAAVGALSVKNNAYTLRVRPATVEGAAAVVSVDASGYFQIDNGLTTSASGAPSVIAEDRATPEGVALSLRGTVPLGSPGLAYERRVPAPLLFAGYLFVDALRAAGIQTAKKVRIATCPPELPLIQLQSSPPLGQMLSRLGKDSDNFVAEMLLKVLGAERTHTAGKSSDGTAAVIDILKQLDVPTAGLVMLNGSGLFQGNRVSAEQIAALLAAMYANPSYRDDYVAQLAVGGVDGTLARRFRKLPRARIVRAKTGTLDDVIALSGYVLGPTPDRAYAFSFLANGVSGKHAQA